MQPYEARAKFGQVDLLSRRDLTSASSSACTHQTPNLPDLSLMEEKGSRGDVWYWQVDDKEYVQEKLIQLLASLPDDSTTHLGKSGSCYARTVTPKHGEPKPHLTKISSLLFALVDIIIQDVFRASDRDKDIVNASSYLDLSPLYGSDQDSQDAVRTFSDGKLKPDNFCEVRFVNQPPEVSALLLCFNRFHNSIVEQLALINEGGRYSLPSNIAELDTGAYAAALAKRDNDIFQTARLVTSGLYVQITSWNLDPRMDVEEILGTKNMEKATGNQVSVEFNLIYRWHSTISAKNERWLNNHLFQISQTPSDPGQRTLGGLQRNARGYFEDVELVRILTEAGEDVAASFGARQIPVALKVIEVLGIEQARSWGVASLNEMRSFSGMLPYKTFADINSDSAIAATLEALYVDVGNVELYPGVLVEESKMPMTPGSGLCPGFTTSRAILSDALALVRGDRFYTTDYTPQHLTSFGFREARSDTAIAGGGVMYKLFSERFVPGYYRGNSIYALYPSTVPSEMRQVQKSLGREADFTYDPPQHAPAMKVIADPKTVLSILRDSTSYTVPCCCEVSGAVKQQKILRQAVVGPANSTKDFARLLEITTSDMMRNKSHKLRDISEVDVIKDVAMLSWTQLVARLFIIPLKDSLNSKAAFDDKALHVELASVFRYLYCDDNPAISSKLKQTALQAYKDVNKELSDICDAINCSSFAHVLLHRDHKVDKDNSLPNHGDELLQRLLDGGKTVEEITSTAVLMAVQIATNEALRVYVLEALRLSPPVAPVLRVSDTLPSITDWRYAQAIKKGDILHLDVATASRDPFRFPDPNHIKLDRPQGSYLPFADGIYGPLVREIVVPGLVAQLRIFGNLKGLKEASGIQGRWKRKCEHEVVAFLNEAQDE
ncbi:heme peroxidase [Setomelanomma holmii]|uniref:Heme peroxidase n=1 Tax=Setomelanomma holmii TaxID=210430 RepID=A0A9P4LQW7_9PLEO|nr:heme peroxidase [Setomelanomma holmii]